MRAFGEAVEAASGSGGPVAEQLTRACTDALARALPDLLDRLTKHIDERLAHDRQRVNLNVRAPKRARSPQVSRDISGAGRPLPIARFLDDKEREKVVQAYRDNAGRSSSPNRSVSPSSPAAHLRR